MLRAGRIRLLRIISLRAAVHRLPARLSPERLMMTSASARAAAQEPEVPSGTHCT